MAAVLEFRPHSVRRPCAPERQSPSGADDPCEIVIFPGVRRERREAVAAACKALGGSDDGPGTVC